MKYILAVAMAVLLSACSDEYATNDEIKYAEELCSINDGLVKLYPSTSSRQVVKCSNGASFSFYFNPTDGKFVTAK